MNQHNKKACFAQAVFFLVIEDVVGIDQVDQMFRDTSGVVADLEILTAADGRQFFLIEPADVDLDHQVRQALDVVTQVHDLLGDFALAALVRIDHQHIQAVDQMTHDIELIDDRIRQFLFLQVLGTDRQVRGVVTDPFQVGDRLVGGRQITAVALVQLLAMTELHDQLDQLFI